jgi:hypothetical protein
LLRPDRETNGGSQDNYGTLAGELRGSGSNFHIFHIFYYPLGTWNAVEAKQWRMNVLMARLSKSKMRAKAQGMPGRNAKWL